MWKEVLKGEISYQNLHAMLRKVLKKTHNGESSDIWCLFTYLILSYQIFAKYMYFAVDTDFTRILLVSPHKAQVF